MFFVIFLPQPYGAEISSDAFQKFLSERAAAADKLPTIPAAVGGVGASGEGSGATGGANGADKGRTTSNGSTDA